MSRLEQAVTRSGWTSWASTAALGAIAWIFISLLDGVATFPWSRFAVLVTLLSFVQEFVYALDYVLRPRRGIGLLVGTQLRVMRSRETLPFARRQYLFYFVRGSLLAAASYLLLPDLVGGWWWLLFIVYLLVVVTMCISVVLSMIDRPIPKHEDSQAGELFGHGLILYTAWLSLSALLETWQDGDFAALKAAFLVIAAIHVLRGLAEPRYEIPALEQLQDVRRRLGFGRITPLQAVLQAEAALFGHFAVFFLADSMTALGSATDLAQAQSKNFIERVDMFERQVKMLASLGDIGKDDIMMRESVARENLRLFRVYLRALQGFGQARERLTNELEHFKKRTQNDASVPMVEQHRHACDHISGRALVDLLRTVPRLIDSVQSLEELAAKHKTPLAPNLRSSLAGR
ncbi:hypothetical protein OV203_21495 [Nannocystis sp. ILAH1]|uniref:hypothetical protein n=2 Tax=Nannocystis sp. ILAH1 TaxID=2996789 RepID=UPI00226DEDCE|nr:hypothetical protein [Nannocystis sp. ILAH1]MCY0989726.1 hypothetical protein [Nannocystis sp. ILAH1]